VFRKFATARRLLVWNRKSEKSEDRLTRDIRRRYPSGRYGARQRVSLIRNGFLGVYDCYLRGGWAGRVSSVTVLSVGVLPTTRDRRLLAGDGVHRPRTTRARQSGKDWLALAEGVVNSGHQTVADRIWRAGVRGGIDGVSLVTERIWSLRVGAAGGHSDRDPVLYSGIACCVELQEVSPRPRRTTVALELRAVSDGSDVAHVGEGFDASSPLFGFGPASGNFVGNGEQQLAYCASAFGGSRC
jgi:hypothetical protein